jgi:hypothetical protein
MSFSQVAGSPLPPPEPEEAADVSWMSFDMVQREMVERETVQRDEIPDEDTNR